MTISQAIVQWLKCYEAIKIETNHVQDGSDKYGLFKSPNRDIKNFINQEYEITEYYQFLARQSCHSDSERKEADEWLEDLTYWADDYSYNYEYPELDGSRKILSIEITGNPYPMEADGREALYQIALSITYIRERRDAQWP